MKVFVSNIEKIIKLFIAFAIKNSFVFLIILKFLYDFIAVFVIKKWYSYSGFIFDFSILKYILSFGFFLLSLFLVKNKKVNNTFSSISVSIIYLFYFLPFLSFFSFFKVRYLFFILSMIYLFLLFYLNNKIKYFRFPFFKNFSFKYIFYPLEVILCIIIIFISYKYANLRLNFNFFNVYSLRLAAKKISMPIIFRYIMGISTILIPLLMVYSLSKKKYFSFGLLSLTDFLLYSFDGQKSIFLGTVIILVCYLFYNKNYEKLLPIIIIGAFLFGTIELAFIDTQYFFSYIFRRIIFLPLNISNDYYLFSLNNTINLFTNGPLRYLGFSSFYPFDISVVLGNFYMLPITAYNTGLLGDAFINLGVLGVIVMPVLLILSFRIFDACNYNTNVKILSGFAVFYTFRFVNSSFTITLLSGGFLISALVLLLMSNDLTSKDKKEAKYIELKIKNLLQKKSVVTAIIIIVVSSVIGFSYGCMIDYKNSSLTKDRQYNNIILKQMDDDYQKHKYLIGMIDSYYDISQEINYFVDYFNLTSEKELAEDIYIKAKELYGDDYSFAIMNKDNEKEYYLYSQVKPKTKENKVYTHIYKDYDELYIELNHLTNKINQISNNIISNNNNINITYKESKNIVTNYNIFFTTDNNQNNSKYIMLLIMFCFGVLVSSSYFLIQKEENN